MTNCRGTSDARSFHCPSTSEHRLREIAARRDSVRPQPFEVRLPYDYAIHVCLGGLARRDARGMFSNDGVDLIDECELRVRSETKPQVDVLGAHERFIEPGPFGSEQLAVVPDSFLLLDNGLAYVQQ